MGYSWRLANRNGAVISTHVLTGRDANYTKLNAAFEFVANRIKPGDVCLLYFGTHGGQRANTTNPWLCLYNHRYTEQELANHVQSLNAVSEHNPNGNGVAVIGFVHACHSGGIADNSSDDGVDGYCVPNAWCVNSALVSENTAWVTATDKPKALSVGKSFSQFLLSYGWEEGWAGSSGKALSCKALADYTKKRVDALFDGITMKNEHGEAFVCSVGVKETQEILEHVMIGICGSHDGNSSNPTDPQISAEGKDERTILVSCSNMYNCDEVLLFKKRGAESCYETWGEELRLQLINGNVFVPDDDVESSGRDCPYYYQVRTYNGAGVGKSNEDWAWRVHTESHRVTFMYNAPAVAQGGGVGVSWELPYDSTLKDIWNDLENRVTSLNVQGFTHTGWFTEPNGRGVRITEDVRVLAPVTYYADWTPMTKDWLDNHPRTSAAANGDIATAATMTAANGCSTVGECYVAGLDPDDPTSKFVTTISMNADGSLARRGQRRNGPNGKPIIISWDPDLNENGMKNERVYRILGAKSLGGPWDDVTDIVDLDAEGYRFFKATVEMP